MNRVFFHYEDWEDYKNGMYEIPSKPYNENVINACVELLSQEDMFYREGLLVLDNWTNSCHHNLSNVNINRQAWLGQAVCSYKYKAQELITREVWSRMRKIDRIVANSIADKLIGMYEEKNRRLYPNVGSPRLF